MISVCSYDCNSNKNRRIKKQEVKRLMCSLWLKTSLSKMWILGDIFFWII